MAHPPPPPPTLASLVSSELRKFPGLDAKAVLAIAAHEGLGGGIGDNGTSFGPFQLHWQGAYPMSAPHGNAQQSQAWASSPQGIDYALRQINGVAGGLHGANAISAISRRFERPANPDAEIQDALNHYGGRLPQGVVSGSAPRLSGPSPAAGSSGEQGPTGLQQLLASTVGETNQSLGLGSGGGGLFQLLLSRMSHPGGMGR